MNFQKTALVLLPPFYPETPPLGLACLKSFLKTRQVDVDCFDFNHFFFQKAPPTLKTEWKKSVNPSLEENITTILKKDFSESFLEMTQTLLKYEILGFSCFKSNILSTLSVSALIKELNPRISIIYGGPEITSLYFKFKKRLPEIYGKFGDHFVAGEGEIPLLNFLENPDVRPRLSIFKERLELSRESPPDFSDFDSNRYPKKDVLPLILSRGCPNRCRFCAERLLYRKYRRIPVENALKQIRLLNPGGEKRLVFHDSLFNGDFRWLEQFAKGIIARWGSIPWEAQMGIPQDMPFSLLKTIKQSGCYHLFIGLESGCDRVLRLMNKPYSGKDALRFFQQLQSEKLSFGISLITGFPGETQKDFNENLNFILENHRLIPKIEQINPFVHYCGIPVSKSKDYRKNPKPLKRARLLIQKIKENGLKHTNAFLLNLVEPQWKSVK